MKPKVMVNILHIGTIHAGLETMVVEWMHQCRDKYDFSFFLPTARPIPNNRNKICKQFIEGSWEYLFMFDEDTIPLKNPFSMIEHDLDVCGGVYPGRSSKGFNFHVFDLDKEKYKNGDIFFEFIQDPNRRVGVQKVDAVATGCVCIKRSVIEKMYKNKMAPFEELFDEYGIMITSDDMAFCLKCMKLNIKVHADWDILCDHIKETPLLKCIELISKAAKSGIAEINTSGSKDIKQGEL
jgi:hypothetical protein